MKGGLHCIRFAESAVLRQCGAAYWPYCTSIGYLRLSTVCSEPLLNGPPQWKCSCMVWYTSGRPPPLTAIPLPICSKTGSINEHVTFSTKEAATLFTIVYLQRIYLSVRRFEASTGLFGSHQNPQDVKAPGSRFWSCDSPSWWESDGVQVKGDMMGNSLPMHKGLRVEQETQGHQIQRWSELFAPLNSNYRI